MDPSTVQALATSVIATLTPALVQLVTTAAKPISTASGDLGKALGQSAGEHIAALMNALTRKFKGRAAAEEAVDDFAKNPSDQDAQAALRLQLKKALESDAAFLNELNELLQRAQESAQKPAAGVIASGDRSVATGRDVKGTIVTGDVQGNIEIKG